MPDVDALFVEELARRGVTAARDEEGNYKIDTPDATLSISLFNLRKEIARDGDLERVPRFVDTILSAIKTPTWEEAKPWVRWQLEPIDSPLEDSLHDQVSDQVALVLVLASPDETQIRWIGEATAKEWGQTKDALVEVAADNMAVIAEQVAITVETIDGHKLGMVGTEWPAYKAALLFSRGFRPKAEPVLGWPVFAVMPCRDFVYVVPAADKELLPRLGPVVVKEFRQGAYPLSTEVFELTDREVRAAFEFQKPPAGNADIPDDPAWRIVQYGGFLRFRVPVQWTDEPIQRGTEYFDPKGIGRLLACVLGTQLNEPVTHASAGEYAKTLAKRESSNKAISVREGNVTLTLHEPVKDGENFGTVTPRDPATWLVEIPPIVSDDATVWGWMLVAAVPPNQVHIVSFKYYVPTAVLAAEPERVEQEREMVRQEVVTAYFNPVPIPTEEKPAKAKGKPAPAAKPKRDKGEKN